MSTPNEPVIMKRYASRRLYNTEISEYVTLDDVARMIREGRDIKIIDSKTDEDLTKPYLLQIISELESSAEEEGSNGLPVNVLTELVRSYTDQAQNMMPDFLAKSMEIYKEQQAAFFMAQKAMMKQAGETMKGGKAANPAAMFAAMPGTDMMKAWQDRMSTWLGQGLTGNIAAGMTPFMGGMGNTMMNSMSKGAAKGATEGMIEGIGKTVQENMDKAANMMPFPKEYFDLESWQKQQQKMFGAAVNAWMPSADGTKAKKTDPREEKMAAMKKQLSELEAEIKKNK